MRITYDAEACAVYLYISTEVVARTEEVSPDIYVDFDAAGEPVGIEVLNVATRPEVEALG